MAFTTLSGYFMEPIGNLVSLQLTIQEANISMKRLSEIMDYEREPGTESGLPGMEAYQEFPGLEGDIQLSHVTFRYGNRHCRMCPLPFRRERKWRWWEAAAVGNPPLQNC